MQAPTANGMASDERRPQPQITARRPNVATAHDGGKEQGGPYSFGGEAKGQWRLQPHIRS
jgi:hypothetical protein